MKKIILIMVVMLTALFFVGCGVNETSTSNNANQIKNLGPSGNLRNCIVEIKDCTIGKDELSDAEVITVTFGFTNNFADNMSFVDATIPYAFQNGIELENTYAEGESRSCLTILQPGASLDTVTLSWILANTTDPVDIEILENMSDGKTKVTKTFNLQ
jgi:hypothetical protein